MNILSKTVGTTLVVAHERFKATVVEWGRIWDGTVGLTVSPPV